MSLTPEERRRLQKADQYMADRRERIAQKKRQFVLRLGGDSGRGLERPLRLLTDHRGMFVRKRKRREPS